MRKLQIFRLMVLAKPTKFVRTMALCSIDVKSSTREDVLQNPPCERHVVPNRNVQILWWTTKFIAKKLDHRCERFERCTPIR